jgi:hypothetical protein
MELAVDEDDSHVMPQGGGFGNNAGPDCGEAGAQTKVGVGAAEGLEAFAASPLVAIPDKLVSVVYRDNGSPGADKRNAGGRTRDGRQGLADGAEA